ncbi:MAG: DUF4956 domain-containing protein [Gemmatimonas sp.]
MTLPPTKPATANEPSTGVVARCAIYYAVLIGVGVLVWKWLPHGGQFAPASLEALFGSGSRDAAATLSQEGALPAAALDDVSMAITVAVAMLSSVLLSIPVAWVYLLTRAKRGYQQSVVQLLIMLPAVVTGIVILVKYSLALAFSLAGIVAAVRFRNSLDDSKDAVYVFLATAIGLAAAVNLPVALVLSVGFNLTVFMLWYTDFGSAPVELDGRIAEKRLNRARSLARTGTFVARMDEEVFQNMTREQLRGVAERAMKRAAVTGEQRAVNGSEEASRTLRLRTRDAVATRRQIEPRLSEFTKGWRFGSVHAVAAQDDEEASMMLEYIVQLKKRITPDELMAVLRTAGAPQVHSVELQ